MKPGNLLLDRQGLVKVLDMGLARFFHEDTAAFIKEYEVGYIIGTADYVAPEQIIDSRVDIRADIYSLGGTLYYLLVGKSPFQDGNNAQKMIWHQVRQPKSLRQLRPDVPEDLVRVMEKMLAKEPTRRYQEPAEVAAALEACIHEPVELPTNDELPPSILAACCRPLSQASQTTTPTSAQVTDRAPGAERGPVVLPGKTPRPRITTAATPSPLGPQPPQQAS
jgi:serine/threonine protein kinase